MPTSARVTVRGPVRTPRRFGLFSVAEVEDVTDPHALMGVQWEPLTCDRAHSTSDGCPCVTENKVFTPGTQPQDATPFVVHGSWQCAKLGTTVEAAARAARAQLEIGEQQAVEWELWTGTAGAGPRLAHPDTVDLGEVRCATDLLAAIEDYTAAAFNANPVIHVPRPVVPYLVADHLITTVAGSRLETTLGVPVAAGAGYAEANTGPDGTPAPAGSWWVYVTGPIKVWRGPIVAVPDPGEAGFMRCSNELVALAERTYLVGWDCITAAVLFTPCCACGAPPPRAGARPRARAAGGARFHPRPRAGRGRT
jgi:hypothetical protein